LSNPRHQNERTHTNITQQPAVKGLRDFSNPVRLEHEYGNKLLIEYNEKVGPLFFQIDGNLIAEAEDLGFS
jgi:hypothetical protein